MRRGSALRSIGLAALVAFAPLEMFASAPAAAAQAAQVASPVEPCGSEIYLEAQLARDPEFAARRAMLEALVQDAVVKGLAPKPGDQANSSAIYTIPVVVHIVHNGGAENILYSQVLSQIEAINRDCQNVPANAPPAVDCKLQFCLATQLPLNSSVQWANSNELGVTRFQKATPFVLFGNSTSEAALKAIDYVPSNQYLNVWVVQSIKDNVGNPSGVVGYATFPGGPATLDGIVMDYRFMGANNTSYGPNFSPPLMAYYDEGKVFAHEVGHWLDLYHPFHNGCVSGLCNVVGDRCCDTPAEALPQTGNPTNNPTSCGNSGDPIHNFMDYTNDPCRYQFTSDQRARMHAALTTDPSRMNLVSPGNVAYALNSGPCQQPLYASITLGAKQACVNDAVPCSGSFCNNCSYAWSAQGGTVANPTAQNTTVQFGSPGMHTVTLTMTDTNSNSSTATEVVYVTACTPISGSCANWVFSSRCRLSFATGMPVAVGGTVNIGSENATQFSDPSTGALMFYTDNETVWNANNAAMLNGTGLWGGGSSHTGTIVIPRPLNPGQYYLISVYQQETTPPSPDGFPIHINTIDMSGGGGLGQVVVKNFPIALDTSNPPNRLLEGVTAIPHCNGTDWWVVTHGSNANSQYLYITLVTQNGAVSTTPYPTLGMGGTGNNYTAWGSITASQDGTKIAVCRANEVATNNTTGGAIRAYKFNRATGVPVAWVNTGNIDANQDLAFSPDGNLIYYCYLKSANLHGIRQLNLNNPSQVRTITSPTVSPGDLDVELGPDDKIYVAPAANATSLHCINFPNNFNSTNSSNECGFNRNAIPLGFPAKTTSYGTLPNTLAMCTASAAPPQFSYAITNCNTVNFTTPNCSPWTWSFGDQNSSVSSLQNPTFTYPNGTFTVTLNVPSASPASISKTFTIGGASISIAGNNTTCGGPSNYSVIGPSNYVYNWTITGGSPATATGNNVQVSWGLTTGIVQVVGTDPVTGCTSMATLSLESCSECATPPLGMVAWWPLDESPGGTLAQELVAANTGQDASVASPGKVAGAVANGRLFGTSGYVRVNDAPKLNLGTGNLTIDAWINTSSTASPLGIVDKRTLSPDVGYALYLKQGRLALRLSDGTSSTEYWDPNTASLADGKWHHVAAIEDRSGGASGTKLYRDGLAIAQFPAYSSGNVDNAERLLIGALQPSNAPVSSFDGRIDEVEIFKKALSDQEIRKVWGAGPAGKCKEFPVVPSSTVICEGWGGVPVDIYVWNQGSTNQTFNLAFGQGSGANCTAPPPVTFTPPQVTGLVVPKFSCSKVTIMITRPGGLSSGGVSCYTVSATNAASNVTHVATGSLWANDNMCLHVKSGGLSSVKVSVPATATWGLRNTSPVVASVPFEIVAVPTDGDPGPGGPGGPGGAVSLNGLPPGVPVLGNLFLSFGDSADVSVEATFVEERPFREYELVLSCDIDGDGSYGDLKSSSALLYSELATPIVGVPRVAASLSANLLDASPNPFGGQTAVQFALPRASWIRLALYDVNGRRVTTLAQGVFGAGRVTRTVRATGLASGVYFLRLEGPGLTRTKRVVLLRE